MQAALVGEATHLLAGEVLLSFPQGLTEVHELPDQVVVPVGKEVRGPRGHCGAVQGTDRLGELRV
ncbi:hypothetical protein [Kitasatospora aureofaciens]|uniref:hypothetical protein n=1 Tax=Kitasatospora aureofaciens TaxID=1894 RepID=UPI00131C57A4|nr:hypothetical protein [Kitasatospora aureofaciens]